VKTDLQIERWPLDRLIPYARNPRTHTEEQVAQIAASIVEFGWTNPVLVGADGVIIAGHARLQAARKLGMSEVPVIVLDHLSEAQRRALVIADNQLALAGTGWDEDLLRGLLVDLRQDEFNLDVLGFSDEELNAWLSQEPGDQEGLTEEDAVPEPLEEPVTRRGDLWLLGNHRLLCGDSASSEDVKRLVEGAPIDLVNTDPPYNVRVEPRSNNAIAAGLSSFAGLQHHQSFDVHRGASKAKATTKKMRPKDRALANDFMKDGDYDVLLESGSGTWRQRSSPAAPSTSGAVTPTAPTTRPRWWNAACTSRRRLSGSRTPGVDPERLYGGNHEWAFYGWREGAAHWFNPEITNATDVWSVAKVSPNAMVHLTEKPVELAVRALTYSSKAGESVLDLFGGSGSTLIACEKLGRRARLMEIDPPYCDVIVRRWQEFAGKAATLEGDGRSFDEIRGERIQDRA
jgi:16S rRNA G966 N2-methylase RsmD